MLIYCLTTIKVLNRISYLSIVDSDPVPGPSSVITGNSVYKK